MTEQPLPKPGDLLTETEAAEIYKLAVTTLRNWRALKQGPRFVKIGARCVRYRRADLADFMDASNNDGRDAA